jgi:hypothetical protein
MELFRTRPTEPDIRLDWPHAGSTSQTDFYWTKRGVLIAVPHVDAIDDRESSRENAEFQREWARQNGPYGLVVFVDRLRSQDRDARETYSQMGRETFVGVALVNNSMLARAIASFFVGISKPAVEYRMFDSLMPAIDWLEGIVQ